MSTEARAAAFKAARDFLFAHRTDYATAHRDFRWPELTHFNYALDWFDAELARGESANRLALRIVGDGAASVTFAELSERSNRIANGLRALGVKRNERILLMLGNVVPLWETMLAAMKLGAVVIPATTLLTPSDLKDRFERGRVRHLVATTADAPKSDGLDPSVTRIAVGAPPSGWIGYDALLQGDAGFVPEGETKATDPLLLYFTSGTTSRPKLVEHSHQSYPVGHLTTMYWLNLQPGDMHLNISSPGWAKHAYSCFFAPWNAGATVFIANQPRFNAPAMLQAIAENQVTTICAPPTVWRMFAQEDMAAIRTSLRELCSAGEPLNPEIIEHVQKVWGKDVREAYGQTETTVQIACFPGQKLKPGSMGQEAPGYRIRLLDADDKDVEEGEVCIDLNPAPVGLMRGYQADDGTFAPRGRSAYRTGDVGTRDAEGYFTYVGRADDVFKASDYRISPFELESVLIEHASVAEAAVVPAPDPLRMAVPKAYVVLAAGVEPGRATALSIFQHLRARLAPFKRVRRIEFADLPKTISGKIRRVELRRTEEAHAKSGTRAQGEFREEDFPELSAR
ncbi:MAG: AMP-dependent synthetase [Rhodospirillales bacterium 69-11]|nr:AMP-binding protein [Rhodospirillales bacterium]OJW25190.1 MAG: AMP-dependent synthetase [Rhodospirillales bacterium 69-11]